jgi:hypothetical protein
MGIKKFGEYFENKEVKTIRFERIYVDVNYYYYKFFTNIRLNVQKLSKENDKLSENYFDVEDFDYKSSESITLLFYKYITSRLLPCLLENGKLVLVLDSPVARKNIKFCECLDRQDNYEKIRKEQNTEDFQPIDLHTLWKNVIGNVFLIKSDYDADTQLFNLVIQDTLDGYNNRNMLIIEDKEQILSNIAIFSADSDFLAFAPLKSMCCIMDIIEYSHFRGNSDQFIYKIKNFNIVDNVLRSISLSYQSTIDDHKIQFFFLLKAMTSPNDFITCSFWDQELFEEVANNVFFMPSSRSSSNSTINFVENIKSYKNVAFHYFASYFQKHRFRPELFRNALRNLGAPYLKFDSTSNQLEVPESYNQNIINKLHAIVTNYDVNKIKDLEDNFKNIQFNRELCFTRNLIKEFLNQIENNKLSNDMQIFHLSTSCAIFLLATNLINTFFPIFSNNDDQLKSHLQLTYLSRSLYSNKNKYALLYENFVEKLIFYFNEKRKLNIKICAYVKYIKTPKDYLIFATYKHLHHLYRIEI